MGGLVGNLPVRASLPTASFTNVTNRLLPTEAISRYRVGGRVGAEGRIS